MASEMNVPYYDMKSIPTEVKIRWESAVSQVISSGRYIGGPEVQKFENAFVEFLGGDLFCIGVGNGLDALTLSLRALELPAKSKIAVPAHTFIATWLAIDSAGHIPVGIDADEFGLIDLSVLESKSDGIAAVIPVHMHGQMVNMERLSSWAKPRKIWVIEDCAQAHGAKWANKPSGTWGDLGAFSFYPTKNLGAIGDAGAIVTANPTLAEKVRSLSNYGSSNESKYVYNYVGVNSRLDPIQASILNVNLEYLSQWNANRILNANRYMDKINNSKVRFLGNSQSVWHHFALLTDNRDKVRQALESKNIQTEIHYPQSASKIYQQLKKLPNKIFYQSDNIANSILSLPLSPWMEFSEIDYVANALNNIIDELE